MRTLFSPLHEFLKKGDLVLLSLCLLTSGFGVALIFSATRYNQNTLPPKSHFQFFSTNS